MNEIVSHRFGAIQEDITFLIDRLVAKGLKQIIVVEFPSGVPDVLLCVSSCLALSFGLLGRGDLDHEPWHFGEVMCDV